MHGDLGREWSSTAHGNMFRLSGNGPLSGDGEASRENLHNDELETRPFVLGVQRK